MKKLSGLLAVSLIAIMMAPAARADIASTAYVDTKDAAIRNDMEVKANKKTSTEQLSEKDDTSYPTVAAAYNIANVALGDNAVEKEQGTAGANKALITNASGTVTTGTIATGMITNSAVTNGKIANGAVTADKIGANAVTTAKIADSAVTDAKLATDSVTPLKVKDGLITAGTNVTVSRNASTGVVTISSADTKYTLPAATDKVLGGVMVDTAMSDTSTNPVQNKVANAAIADAKKAGTDAATAAANAKSAADAAQKTASAAVVANTAITGGTKTKITYDAKGLVTGGSDLTAADIPAGLIKNGTNVTVSRDATTGVVTISSADTKYTLPAATDKVLGGVMVDTAMSDTSTNPVQNKVANAAIADAKKAGTDAATAAANAKSAADAAQKTASAAVVANTAITGGTKTKITYDAKGLVTGGSDLTAADIPALATSKITGLDTALAAKFVAPAESATSTDGTYTLTMKVVNSVPTYTWEKIGR